MYKKTNDKITCENCGNEQTAIIWGVVDGNVNTRTKQKIIDGTFFEHRCKSCGEVNFITHPVLYEDTKLDFMVYYVESPLRLAEATAAIIGRRSLVKEEDDTRIRITTTPNAFREKVALLDSGCDDRVVEVMKMSILEVLSRNDKIGHVDEILCYFCGDGTIDIDVIGEKSGSIKVKENFYYYVKNKVEKTLEMTRKNPIEVGLDFAIEFMVENHFICE